MKIETSVSSSTAVCVACDSPNVIDAKFCKGCGHSLYEPCGACEAPVLLTQKFCVSCGFDLVAHLKIRAAKNDERLAKAIEAAKAYDFDQSIELLRLVANQKDHRFREAAENAGKALAKVTAMKTSAESSATAAMAAAQKAARVEDHAEVVRLLSKVPTILLDEASRRLFLASKAFIEEVVALESDVRAAVEKRDWATAGGLIGQLIDLTRGKEEYQTLGVRVSKKLLQQAEQLFLAQKYEKAVSKLGSIPPSCNGVADDELRERILNAQWLSAQFDAEPFATPMLGRLAVRFAKEFPDDDDAQGLVKKLSQTLKQSPRPMRMHLPPWKAQRHSWIGGKAGLLGIPTAFVIADQATIRSNAGKFTVALGIGLQALGKARISTFCTSKKKKKGLLGGFSRKKKTGCWAIDIGSSSLKAVRMEWQDDKPVVIDCHYEEFANPFCRVGHGRDIATVLTPVIEKLKAEKDLDDIPIYVNLPASVAITRFVRLPPVSDKQAKELMKLEIEQRLPVRAEDLDIVEHLASLDADSLHGRAAVMTAAKRTDVDARFELLEAIGLECDGLQTDTVAIANFAAFEFAELWKFDESEDEDAEADSGDAAADAKKKKIKKSKKKIQALYNNAEEKTPAVAIVDYGAASTKVVIVSGETHWAWTIESGGEDLTSALARATKLTHIEAEKLKRNPAEIASPHAQYQPLEQRQSELRSRLEKIVQDAKTQNSRFQIEETWCIGGGTLAHGWLRRTLLIED
jgi:Tfp pilus assembly PilM family ATPase